MLDLNGDGRTDAMVQYDGENFYEFLNRALPGNGAEIIDFRNEGKTLPDRVDLSDTRYELADMNGDGLPDLVYQDFYMDPPVFRVWYGMGAANTPQWQDFQQRAAVLVRRHAPG